MLSSNRVNLPGCVVRVINISVVHKHVGPHFKLDSFCGPLHVWTCTAINTERHTQGGMASVQQERNTDRRGLNKRQKGI